MSVLDRLFGRYRGELPKLSKALEAPPAVLATLQYLSGPWGNYGAMYRAQPAVRMVVDFLAKQIAQLNPKVYERVGDVDRLELDMHPLAVILRNPNPVTTRYVHLRDTVSDIAIYDRAYWLKVRERGLTRAVMRLPASKMTQELDPNNPKRFLYRLETGEVYTRDRLVIFAGYNPNGGQGVSPLETLRKVLEEEWSSTVHRGAYWRNAARQSGWIERPLDAPEWSEDARQRFRADMESTMAGRENAGKIGVLEEGMTWNGTAFSPKESEYTEGVKLTIEQVCRVYGVPSSLLGGAGETKSNVEAFHRQLYQDTLAPWLRFLQDEIDLQLLHQPEFNDRDRGTRQYVEFNLRDKLKGSFEEEAKTLVTAVGVPYMAVNQALARLNLPRINDPAFDVPVKPMNVLYGGQPAETVPTEDPGTPETASLEDEIDLKRYEESLRHFFDVQERDVLSKVGLNGAIWADCKRWDRDLALFLHNWAPHLQGQFADIAKSINDVTYDEIRQELEAEGDVQTVFAHAKEQRAAAIAQELVDKGALDDA